MTNGTEDLVRRLQHHVVHRPATHAQLRGVDHESPVVRFNARFGLAITKGVGSMWTGYLFTLLALLSLPYVLSLFHVFAHTFPGWLVKASILALVAWIAQTFLQLVLLPIIIVGQNIQAEAADRRAEATYEDTVALQKAAVAVHAFLECMHRNPQTGPCPGHPELGIPPNPDSTPETPS